MAEVYKKDGKVKGKEAESDVFKPGFENKALVPNIDVKIPVNHLRWKLHGELQQMLEHVLHQGYLRV